MSKQRRGLAFCLRFGRDSIYEAPFVFLFQSSFCLSFSEPLLSFFFRASFVFLFQSFFCLSFSELLLSFFSKALFVFLFLTSQSDDEW